MKLKKIDKVDISLKQLIDVDSSTGITRCVDCIGNGMVLMASVSKNVSVRDSFIFKNLSDIVKGTNGVLTSVTNGILTLSIDPNAISAETSLSELSDVAIAGLADNDYLVYNSVSKKWENSQASFVPTTRHITINGVTQDLSTNRTWTISSGTVTSVTGTGTVSGLTLSGTVTTSGSLTLGGSLTLTSGNVTTALGFTPYNATNPAGYITSSALTNYVTNSSLTSTLTGYVTSGVFNSTISGLSFVYQPILGYTPVTNARTITTSAPLSGGGDLTADRTLSISQATTTTDGYLSSSDFNLFSQNTTVQRLLIFGDASTASGTTTINSPIVLAEDRYYYNLTLASGGSIDLNGWRLFVQNTLDLTNAGASAIHNNGSAGANGLGTNGAVNGGTFNVGRSGKGRSVYGGVANSNSSTTGVHLGGTGGSGGSATANGSAGLQSTAPSNYQIRIGGAGGNGGKGGNSAVATGGAGGSGQIQAPTIVLTAGECVIRIPQVYGFWNVQNFDGTSLNTNTIYGGRNGGGGGGGAGSSTNAARQGGCGGGGGGNTFVFAYSVTVAGTTSSSAIAANGGNGGNGALADNLNCGGGGGAGAGGGGYVVLICNSISTNGITFISANGGTGGTGGNGNGTGIGGNGGIGGVGGRITVIRIKDGTVTQVDGTGGTPSTPATPTNTIGSAGSSGTTATYTS